MVSIRTTDVPTVRDQSTPLPCPGPTLPAEPDGRISIARIVGTLRRIVARRLHAPPASQEATNERN